MNKLTRYKFSDLYEMASGISSKPEQAGIGAPFLSFSAVFNNYFIPNMLADQMDTSELEQRKYSINAGDIFLTRTSEVIDELGMSSVALKNYPQSTYSGFLKRLRPIKENIAYPKFMAFYLRSPLFRKTMTNNAVLTLRASLNEEIFSYLDLLLPEYEEQVKAGDLLFLLSQKIEYNNLINIQLEAITKLLYDYWFVQFDFPDANGKPYKSSGGAMVYNDRLKREIPSGWIVVKFEEYADVTKGDLITAKDAQPGEIKVVAAGVEYSYKHNAFNRPANTITISGSGANAGFINFWREPIFASDCITVRGNTECETLLLLQCLRFIQPHIYSQASGSAQPHVYPSDIKNLDYVIAEEPIIKKFEEIAIPIDKTIAKNIEENKQLTQLRDWLLPLLMNGQCTIS